jgi:hypothetical protein
MARYLVSIQGV